MLRTELEGIFWLPKDLLDEILSFLGSELWTRFYGPVSDSFRPISASLAPKGERFALTTKTVLTIRKVVNDRIEREIQTKHEILSSESWSPDERFLVSFKYQNKKGEEIALLIFREVATGKVIAQQPFSSVSSLFNYHWSYDSQTLWVNCEEGLGTYSLSQKKWWCQRLKIEDFALHPREERIIYFTHAPSGSAVTIATDDLQRQPFFYGLPGESFLAVAWDRKGQRLALASRPNLRIWKSVNEKIILIPGWYQSSELVWSPKGRRIAIFGWTRQQIFDVKEERSLEDIPIKGIDYGWGENGVAMVAGWNFVTFFDWGRE